MKVKGELKQPEASRDNPADSGSRAKTTIEFCMRLKFYTKLIEQDVLHPTSYVLYFYCNISNESNFK